MKNKLYYTAPEVERVEIHVEENILTGSTGNGDVESMSYSRGQWDNE